LGAIPVTVNDVPDEDVIKYHIDEKIDMYVWDISNN